jgi:hypothetical protein
MLQKVSVRVRITRVFSSSLTELFRVRFPRINFGEKRRRSLPGSVNLDETKDDGRRDDSCVRQSPVAGEPADKESR